MERSTLASSHRSARAAMVERALPQPHPMPPGRSNLLDSNRLHRRAACRESALAAAESAENIQLPRQQSVAPCSPTRPTVLDRARPAASIQEVASAMDWPAEPSQALPGTQLLAAPGSAPSAGCRGQSRESGSADESALPFSPDEHLRPLLPAASPETAARPESWWAESRYDTPR